jgi:uncharacterized membrane-anchored protein
MNQVDNTAPGSASRRVLPDERIALNNEWHARPNISLAVPCRCTHMVIQHGAGGADRAHAELGDLCAHYSQSPPATASRFHILEAGSCLVKWENHTEATSYTILVAGNSQPPFAESAVDFLDPKERQSLHDRMFVGVQVEVLKNDDANDPHGYERAKALLGAPVVYGGWMAGRRAVVWSSFRLEARGFVRLVIIDHGMEEEQLGRILQRLLDMESYRMLAMRALPAAREVMATIQELEPQLDAVMHDLAEHNDEPARERALQQITGIAARVEQLACAHAARFTGARAYADIVGRRAEEVREEILDDHQRYTNFLQRALVPAMRTCEAAEQRTRDLAARVNRATSLLTTMVDMQQTRQSHGILESMMARTNMQLRLQQAVEGFSIFAISYYAVGMIKYTLDAAKGLGMPVDSSIVAGISAPVVFAGVYLSVRAVRKRLARDH